MKILQFQIRMGLEKVGNDSYNLSQPLVVGILKDLDGVAFFAERTSKHPLSVLRLRKLDEFERCKGLLRLLVAPHDRSPLFPGGHYLWTLTDLVGSRTTSHSWTVSILNMIACCRDLGR